MQQIQFWAILAERFAKDVDSIPWVRYASGNVLKVVPLTKEKKERKGDIHLSGEDLLGGLAEVDSEGKTIALHPTRCVHGVTKQAVPLNDP